MADFMPCTGCRGVCGHSCACFLQQAKLISLHSLQSVCKRRATVGDSAAYVSSWSPHVARAIVCAIRKLLAKVSPRRNHDFTANDFSWKPCLNVGARLFRKANIEAHHKHSH
jgi:hypothetical protein